MCVDVAFFLPTPTITGIQLAALLLLVVQASYFTANGAVVQRNVTLSSSAGLIKGRVYRIPDGSTGTKFLGIPYGLPPVGERRFKVSRNTLFLLCLSLLWKHIDLLTVGVYSCNHGVLYTIRISITGRVQRSVGPSVSLSVRS